MSAIRVHELMLRPEAELITKVGDPPLAGGAELTRAVQKSACPP